LENLKTALADACHSQGLGQMQDKKSDKLFLCWNEQWRTQPTVTKAFKDSFWIYKEILVVC
jgi:hypothetical protein